MQTFGNVSQQQWDAAVRQYDAVLSGNIRTRVNAMSLDDLVRYSNSYNTPSASAEDVFEHMSKWGGFTGLMLSGRLAKRQSALFERLLAGKSAFDFVPPRAFGLPWYELLETAEPLRCVVASMGRGRRVRDGDTPPFILAVNGCPWECIDASDSAKSLLDLELQLKSDGIGQEISMGDLAKVKNLYADSGPISFNVRFGKSPRPFIVNLKTEISSSQLSEQVARISGLDLKDGFFGLQWRGSETQIYWQIQPC